jgi:nicotinamide-nucleotide amidase
LASGLGHLRAAIVATGSELVRGDRADRNGPFLAGELLRLGIEPARLTIVGDDVRELDRTLTEGLRHDLLCISGGLGPTHDDRTIELLAHAAGVELVLDEQLAEEIETVSRRIAARLNRDYADFAAGVRKQATVPSGAQVVGLAGTAPAVILPVDACVAIALPGPPRELQELWRRALEVEPLRSVVTRAEPPERRALRFYGVSESAVAQALTAAGGEPDGVVVTICARDFEIHVDLFAAPGAGDSGAELEANLASALDGFLFARRDVSTAALVLDELARRDLTLATAESCTGGLVAARLTAVPGSSAAFRGSIVAYADDVKASRLAVPAAVLAEHGAVSAQTAAAMAEGARSALGADVGVSVTGIAGPAGGSAEKPVGLVFLHASGPMGGRGQRLDLPGDRETIRGRATVAALHLVRLLVTGA